MNTRCLAAMAMLAASIAQAGEASISSPACPLPMPLLAGWDLAEASGVRLEAQAARPGLVLCPKDPARPALWYSPSASRTLPDGTVQLWYQRVDKDEKQYVAQRTLCLGEIRGGRFVLPAVHREAPAWGGPNNVVLTRSPHPPTWGGFNVFQILPHERGLAMLYWDQPGASGAAGAMLAYSRDGLAWQKRPGAVFTEHNDAYCVARVGGEYLAYQTALASWPDKPFSDNLDKFKRVITLRTSKNLSAWSPQRPLLSPDAEDSRETEFYLMKVFRYGRGYAGLIMKYYADPARPGKHSALLRHELAVSEDGRAWRRPYRSVELGFWSYADPFQVEGRTHFATWKDGAMVTVCYGLDRLVAAVGAGSFRTRPFARPNRGIALNADASQGWIEATLCDGEGRLAPGAAAIRVSGVDGLSLPMPWKSAALPAVCALRIRLGDGAKLFGVVERP